MNARTMGRSILPLVGAGLFFWTATPATGGDATLREAFPREGPSGGLHP